MAATKTLLQLRTAVIQGASIDGQTGANSRHPSSSIDELINRYIESVRSLVASEGGPQFQSLGDITDIPAATALEGFIEIPWPDDAEEVKAVDVFVSGCDDWAPLDDAEWDQRASLSFGRNYPPSGVGWWAVKDMPDARGSATVDSGTIALFPASLAGSYRVSYIEQFTPLSDDTHKWVTHADWATWVINGAIMELTKRDNNKKNNFALAERAFLRAEARIKSASGRAGPGTSVPVRAGGEWF